MMVHDDGQCNTLRIGPMQVSALPAKNRIETIQRCPPGTCVRVENEVISLHNSPRWNPQNNIYIQQRLNESRIQIYRAKTQITLKTIERPATDKMQMGLRALKNN